MNGSETVARAGARVHTGCLFYPSGGHVLKPLRRGVWRYVSDIDVMHSAVITLLALFATGGLLFVGYLVYVWRMAARAPLQPAVPRVVLVFGRKLVADRPEIDYLQRLGRGLALARAGLAESVLLLGGRSGGAVSEAAAGDAWLRAHGWQPDIPLRLEQASIDSLENLRHARSLLADDGVLPPVALVTSRYHLARCVLLSRRLGFDSEPIAAEASMPRSLRYARRVLLEAGYLMWTDIGTRWGRLIGHRRMMARMS